MSRLRLGIVGTGLIWRRSHEPVLRHMQNRISLAAFCAKSQSSQDRISRQYPQAMVYGDYRDLCSSDDVDAIVVLTPLALNAEVAIAALDGGKDVIVEKPLARTVAEARQVAETARRSGRRIAVLEQEPYIERNAICKDIVASGALGQLVTFNVMRHRRFAPGAGTFYGSDWRIAAEFPLGEFFDGGHHRIAALCGILGLPNAVSGSGVQLQPDYGEYDHLLVMLEFGPVRGVISEGSYLSPRRDRTVFYGTEGILEVLPDRIVVDNTEGQRTIALLQENPWDPMWRDVVHGFSQDEPVLYDQAHALRDLTILEAIDHACKTHERQVLHLA